MSIALRICGRCGDPIPPARHVSAVYCSPLCRTNAWRDRNADIVRERNRNAKTIWRETSADVNRDRVKAWRDAHPEQSRKAARDYFKRNQDVAQERKRAWTERNREHVKDQQARWRRENHERVRSYWHRRRSRCGSGATPDETAALFASASACPLCHAALIGDDVKPSLDHIVPLNVGGSNELANLRIICLGCNLRRPKDGRDLPEAQER